MFLNVFLWFSQQYMLTKFRVAFARAGEDCTLHFLHVKMKSIKLLFDHLVSVLKLFCKMSLS